VHLDSALVSSVIRRSYWEEKGMGKEVGDTMLGFLLVVDHLLEYTQMILTS
jgi:hypothetical protein